MKIIGAIHGSAKQAVPLIVNKDTVYVHTDIKELEDNLYEYHEIQYAKDEYIELISNALNNGLADADAINIDQEYRLTLIELGV